jgi:ethanolaminephosphotransferase
LIALFPFVSGIILYGADFSTPVESWWCYSQAVCYLIYRVLDDLDGKQARKTGNSSPLGLIFDHGCDAYNVIFQMVIILKALEAGNNELPLWIFFCGTMIFYVSIIQEYYTGELELGKFNAVSEGSVILYIIFIYMGIVGP